MTDYPEPDVEVPTLSPSTLAERLDAGEPVRLLDVRNRDEFEEWRVDGPSVTTTLLPYMKWVQAEATETVADLAGEIDGDGPVLVVCGRGEASAYVAGLLVEAGVEARNLAGGMRGWARVYRATELPAGGEATVVQYRRPASGCLGYLVAAGDEAAVVDPLRTFTDRYVADATERGVEITHVVDTHVHADHVSGLRDLADATGATPVMPRLAVERGVTYDVETVVHGETITVGGTALRAVHVPGHTTGMTAFLVGGGGAPGSQAASGDGVLLSGDSLFVESVARPDLERGADGATALAARLHESLTERLADLPDGTLVAPGHYGDAATPAADGSYTASLGTLRERLAVFRTDRDEFAGRVVADMPPRPANFERIIATNLGRADVDDDEAFELELGPNNCAAGPSAAD